MSTETPAYVRLARAEEREALSVFGESYIAYMARVPAFVPRLSCLRQPRGSG